MQFPWQQEAVIRYSQRVLSSFQHWTGRSLLNASGSPQEIAQARFDAPLVPSISPKASGQFFFLRWRR